MDFVTIINVPISIGHYANYINKTIELAANSVSSYVCLMNVHMLVVAYFEKSFHLIIEKADIVAPDGKPLTWALRLLNKISQERVAGMDLLPSLLCRVQLEGFPTYFYRGTVDLLNKATDFLRARFPGLNVAGCYSPPFRELTQNEENEVIEKINASKANIVFVVLGCPKQEKWMADMRGKINAVMIGIGGALQVMVGIQKRAPIWMQEIGLEWLYRLHLEPKRLFKRYAITNCIFIFLVIKELLKKKLSCSKSIG
jgi:N-acetylglucosaminyldiphosphoundecaprenol N-acetyl-beta-D-mannosaminyltransferase